MDRWEKIVKFKGNKVQSKSCSLLFAYCTNSGHKFSTKADPKAREQITEYERNIVADRVQYE